MVSPVKTSRTLVQDFLKYDLEERYTSLTATIKNNTGVALAAGAIQPGMPLKKISTQWVTVDAGDEASAIGWLIDPQIVPALAIAGITPKQYRILVCGPALVNPDAAPNDPQGSAYTIATLITALAALSPPVKVLREPATTETQTT